MSKNTNKEELLDLFEKHSGKLPDSLLRDHFGDQLEGRLKIYEIPDGNVYQLISDTETIAQAKKVSGLDDVERLVYQEIEKAHENGIWTQDIKNRTKLPPATLNKCLKRLEERHLIKPFNSIKNKKRKMYISFNLEPSKSHVGGAWYSDQALDVGFIHTISKVIEKLLADSPEGLKLSSITQKVNEYKCSTIHIFLIIDENMKFSLIVFLQLTDEDISELLNSMVCDNIITEGDGTETIWKIKKQFIAYDTFSSIPCGICPRMKDCHDGTPICPEKCVYFQQWLQL